MQNRDLERPEQRSGCQEQRLEISEAGTGESTRPKVGLRRPQPLAVKAEQAVPRRHRPSDRSKHHAPVNCLRRAKPAALPGPVELANQLFDRPAGARRRTASGCCMPPGRLESIARVATLRTFLPPMFCLHPFGRHDPPWSVIARRSAAGKQQRPAAPPPMSASNPTT
jgi:hypothetical protein